MGEVEVDGLSVFSVGQDYVIPGWYRETARPSSVQALQREVADVNHHSIVETYGQGGVKNYDGSAIGLAGCPYHRRTKGQCAVILRDGSGAPVVFCRKQA